MNVRVWHCGAGHTFLYGDEDWHFEMSQGLLSDGAPVPMYCTEVWTVYDADPYIGRYEGEPCLESHSLIYD